MHDSANPPIDQLTQETQAELVRVSGHPMLARIASGTITRGDYELLLWGLRGLFDAEETLVWASRADAVREARAHAQRKVPLIERDLVALCGTRLVVPASLNRLLDSFRERTGQNATTGRLLGALFAHEQIARAIGQGAAPLQALHGGQGTQAAGSVTHLLGAYTGQGAVADEGYKSGLAAAVPLQNAVEGAHECFGRLQQLLAELEQHRAPSAIAS